MARRDDPPPTPFLHPPVWSTGTMNRGMPMHLLAINTGSSSLKAALYEMAGGERRELAVQAARFGHDDGSLAIADAGGRTLLGARRALPSPAAALAARIA